MRRPRLSAFSKLLQSGATMNRPGLNACLRALQPGNTLVVWKLDRLGRGVRGLVELLDDLKKRETSFRSLTEGIDTTTIQGTADVQFTSLPASPKAAIAMVDATPNSRRPLMSAETTFEATDVQKFLQNPVSM